MCFFVLCFFILCFISWLRKNSKETWKIFKIRILFILIFFSRTSEKILPSSSIKGRKARTSLDRLFLSVGFNGSVPTQKITRPVDTSSLNYLPLIHHQLPIVPLRLFQFLQVFPVSSRFSGFLRLFRFPQAFRAFGKKCSPLDINYLLRALIPLTLSLRLFFHDFVLGSMIK